MSEQQPILPAQPWYESEVQVRAAIAMGAQLFSIGFRLVELFGYEIRVSAADVDAIVANLMQGVAVWFGWLALKKRQQSPVAPLTMTTSGASVKNAANPSLLDSDPTKTKEKP